MLKSLKKGGGSLKPKTRAAACMFSCLTMTCRVSFLPLLWRFREKEQISGCQIKRRADPRWLHGVTSRPRGYLQGHTKEVLGKCRGNRGSSRKPRQVAKFCRPSSVAYQCLEGDVFGMSQAYLLLHQTDGKVCLGNGRFGWGWGTVRMSTVWCFASIHVAPCSSAPVFIVLYELLTWENVINYVHFVHYLNKEPFCNATMTLNRVPLFCQCGV